MECSPPGSSVLGFPGQEYWNGLPFPSPGDLLNPGMEPVSCLSQPGEDLHPLLLALLPTPSWAFSGLLLAANVKVTTCCRSFLSPYLHL